MAIKVLLIFALLTLCSTESFARQESLFSSRFQVRFLPKLISDCEAYYKEVFTEGFPDKYSQLGDRDRLFYCMHRLNKLELIETDEWFRVAATRTGCEVLYFKEIGELPDEYFLIPRGSKEREDYCNNARQEAWNKKVEKEHEKQGKHLNWFFNAMSFIFAPFTFFIPSTIVNSS